MRSLLALLSLSLLAHPVLAEDTATWGQVKQSLDGQMYAAKAGNAAVKQESAVRVLGVGDAVDGASARLVRNANIAHLKISSQQLEPGHVYTIWAIVFENPSACQDNCNGPDLGDPAVDGTVFGAVAGTVADDDGTAKFTAHIAAGDDGYSDIFVGDGALDGPLSAEIHFIVRSHGPVIPDLIDEQLSTLQGGCDVNACEDVQFGVFLAP
jgi:hypothetical protein